MNEIRFNMFHAIEILTRTPAVLSAILDDLPVPWADNNEAPGKFSPKDVVAHLLYGEKTDWRVRAEIILEHGTSKTFEPFDPFGQMEESSHKTLRQLMKEFKKLRAENIKWLKRVKFTQDDLDKKGIHPSLGEVTLRQLMSAWVVHDLTHLAQITRVMAKQYRNEIGPWVEYFRILQF